MPCNGVTVLTYERKERNDAFRELMALMDGYPIEIAGIGRTKCDKGWRVEDVTTAGALRFVVMLPTPKGYMPVKVAVSDGGAVTLITQGGTYEQGTEILQKMIIKALRLRGVKPENVKWETHRHDHQAPRLAYSMGTSK